jgi:hypothetical protein
MRIVLKDPDHPASRAFIEVAPRVLAAMPKEETSHVLGLKRFCCACSKQQCGLPTYALLSNSAADSQYH